VVTKGNSQLLHHLVHRQTYNLMRQAAEAAANNGFIVFS
jgi:hypothetical protein